MVRPTHLMITQNCNPQLRNAEQQAVISAKAESGLRQEAGFDQAALDEAARQGFANGVFEESEEDRAAVVEEFYLEVSSATDDVVDSPVTVIGQKPRLAAKLNLKAEKLRKSPAGTVLDSYRQVVRGLSVRFV